MDAAGDEILNRLDRLPVWPYPKIVLLVVGIGFFFSFFDIVTIGLALPKIQQQMSLDAQVASWAITSNLIGYIFGSFMDSRICDLWGRRKALYISIAFFSIGSLLSALSPNFFWLIIWRFVIGMGIGSEIVGVSTYLTELSPAYFRGKIMSWGIASGMVAFAIVPFIALALIPNFVYGWRILFLLGGIGGLVVLIMRRFIPISPRWLISKGRHQEALKIVEQAEEFVKRKYPNKKSILLPVNSPQVIESMTLKQIFKSIYKWRIIFFSIIWFIYYIGNYAWLTLAPNLLIKVGFKLEQSLSFIAIASLGFVFGSIVSILVGDKFERKKTLSVIALVWALTLLIIAWFPSDLIVLIGGFIATTTIAAFIPIMYTYTAENFPTSERATCISITDGLGHLGGAFCGQIIFGLYELFKNYNGFAMAVSGMALTGFLTAILISLFGIKMTRKQMV